MNPDLHFVLTRLRQGADPLTVRPDGQEPFRLSLRSLADDQLTFGGLPAGLVEIGDTVALSRAGVTVFRGRVEDRAARRWRGNCGLESFSAYGPWRRLSRIPYVQQWVMMRSEEGGAPTLQPVESSRVVLGQGDSGAPVSLRAQASHILARAVDLGIISDYSVDALPNDVYLPFDECRDITLAQALARTLRYTPRLSAVFDYTATPPSLRIAAPSEEDSFWVGEYALSGLILEERESQSWHPPLCCLLEAQVSGSHDGAAYAFSLLQKSPDDDENYDPERTLRAVLPVSGSETSADRRSLDVQTADFPADLNSADFWRQWHPDLRLLPEGASLTIRDASRSGTTDLSHYPRFIVVAGVGLAELEEAGVARSRVERLLCTAVLTTTAYYGEDKSADSVETAQLSLEVITTDAVTKTYRWVAGFDGTSGETIPDGLADALLAARQSDGLSATVVAHLPPDAGALIPRPGDTRSGLISQSVDIDIRALTVTVAFGPPAALGPVDLAGWLSAFRNIRRSTVSFRRSTGEDGPEADQTFALPSTFSGWSRQSANKVSVTPAHGSSGGAVTLDPAAVPSDKVASLRDLTVGDVTVKALMTEDVELPGGEGMPEGYAEVEGAVVHIRLDDTSDPHKIQVKRGKVFAAEVDADWTDLVVPSAYDA